MSDWTGSLVGGEPCLDFTNTVGWHAGHDTQEKLTAYAELVSWGLSAGIVEAAAAGELLELARRRPREAREALAKARELREALYRLFSSVTDATEPDRRDLEVLDKFLTLAFERPRLVRFEAGFRLEFEPPADVMVSPLTTLARSAANLLSSPRLARVKKCSDETCGWLFVDRSKNRSRKWCDMNDCGNRAKARRHYRRTRRKG